MLERERLRGVIYSVPDPKRLWGFIRWNNNSIFVHQADLLPDVVGRRPLFVGAEVEFSLVPASDGKNPKAVRVEHLFVDTVDPLTHREVSLLVSWDGRIGFLERESADRIALFPECICDFDNVKTQIAVGRWVSHGVEQHARNSSQWAATDAVVHLPEVADAITVPESESVIAQPIFSEQDRKRTIRQLIAAKKSS